MSSARPLPISCPATPTTTVSKARAGDDILAGEGGADQLYGGAGNDTASYIRSSTGVAVNLSLGSGTAGDAAGDTLFDIENVIGSGNADVIIGDAGVNRLEGGGGDDILRGGAGDDILLGGTGNDQIEGGAGADFIDGGAGIDFVDYSSSGGAVVVDLQTATATGGDADGDTFSNIEGVIGSALSDTLYGDGNDNVLNGGAGNDILRGRGGADTLIGGAGVDTRRLYRLARRGTDRPGGGYRDRRRRRR